MAQLDPKRAVTMMKTLRGLTSDANGNQRVVFTPTWAKAVEFFKAELARLGIPIRMDVAGNFWAELAGARPESVVIG
jgi:N-carbamoyl-L-amino-acid hydrolase